MFRDKMSPCVRERTIAQAWPVCLQRIVSYGKLVGATVDQRGDQTYEMLCFRVEVTDPLQDMIPRLPRMPGVTAWGRNDLLDEYYEAEIIGTRPKPSGFSYVYADWIRPMIPVVIDLLRSCPTSRRAVIPISAQDDALQPDPPCLRLIQFLIRGGHLVMITLWRSRDYAGAAATNMYGMVRLQEHVASELGIPVGRYIDVSDSAHIRIGKKDNKNDRGDLCWVEEVI